MPYSFVLILGFILCFIWIELSHRLKQSSPLELKSSDWMLKDTDSGLEVTGWIEISNHHSKTEVMVPDFTIKPIMLGRREIKDIKIQTIIAADHPDEETRSDGYWAAYIVKSKKKTKVNVKLILENTEIGGKITAPECIWLNINWVNYGPFGLINRRDGHIIPIRIPGPLKISEAYFTKNEGCLCLPIKTHILGSTDKIIDVLKYYTAHLIKPGDIVTIGESPLAIMQGRYLDPSSIKPGLIAFLLCRSFHPTSSLATACGLQVLINQVGPTRVIISWAFGVAFKLVGIKGMFYRLAGEQARLIDDITGTTPPYDKTIVLGPCNSQRICEEASAELGVAVAIADVNDLGRVKIISASKHCDKNLLRRALKGNPAGNSNEQTPLVLVRPS